MNAFTNFACVIPTSTTLSYLFPIIPLQQTLNGYAPLQTNPSSHGIISNCILPQNTYTADTDEEILPDFRCKLCSLTISNYTEFQQHIALHDATLYEDDSTAAENIDKEQPHIYQSAQNSLSQLSEGTFIEELNADGMALRCSYCPKMFTNESAVLDHLRVHDNGKEIICVICKNKFVGISGLRKHLSMCHCKNKDRKRCNFCSYKCYQSSDMEKHIARRHTRDFKYKCSYCIKGFATPKELTNHLKRKHFRPKITKGIKHWNKQ